MLFKRVMAGLPVGLALAIAGCGGSSSNQSSQTTHQTSAVAAASPQSGTSSSQSNMPSSQSGMSGSGSSGSMMEAHTGAHVSVASPAPGTVVTGQSVPFHVAVSNFKVDCSSSGTPDHAGVGHYHVTLDGSLINMYCEPNGQLSTLDVKPGKHMLGFIPASNEHADDMKAAKMIPIDYRPATTPATVAPLHPHGKPQIQILSPRPGETVHGIVTMRIAVNNFRLSCAMYGKPDVAGYGHWHLNVDSTTMGMMGMGTMLRMSCANTLSISLAHIKPGTHRFFAILEDNQHAPTPGAMASVSVNVR
jgi:hypothetical protein